MSYSQSRTVSIPYSGSVHYSGSSGCSCGKSVSYSGSVNYSGHETVHIDVNVNTSPFDNEVERCKNSVNLLTGSVVATQAAQINEINRSANEISSTLTEGFFKAISSEISQQIVQLENEANSSLLHLQKVGEKILNLKKQMEKDYNRISSNYSKTFTDLNNELESRIKNLDDLVFKFEQITEENMDRVIKLGYGSSTAVFGKENGNLQAQICIASAKKNAFNAIDKSVKFLRVRQITDNILLNCILRENTGKSFFIPACFAETQDNSFNVHLTSRNGSLDNVQIPKKLAIKFNEGVEYQKTKQHDLEQIRMYFNAKVAVKYSSNEPKIKRVREMIQKIADLNAIRSPVCEN
jgi:hypothetical protein